jgi:two-component system sensor histidine kinase UhpB
MLAALQDESVFRVEFEELGEPVSLAEAASEIVYSVADEALAVAGQNGATQVRMLLEGDAETMSLSILHNGHPSLGVGRPCPLASVGELLEEVDGELTIRPRPGGGCELRVRVPAGPMTVSAADEHGSWPMRRLNGDPNVSQEAPATDARRRRRSRWPDVLKCLEPSSLYWRVFVVNALLLLVATVLLALSPATVSFPLEARQGLVLGIGLLVVLAANAVLLRLSLAPLGRLARLMRRVDLLEPGERLPTAGGREIAALIANFNDMLGRLEAERQASSSRSLAEQEEERRRVAAELHDEIGQGLTALLLQLKNIQADAPEALQSDLLEAQRIARTNLDELRRIARQLRPGALDDLGLPYALAALVDVFARSTDLTIKERIETELPPVPPAIELAAYRIAQESFTNVARHAGASKMEVSLNVIERGLLRLCVRDNGRGLGDTATVEGGGGIRGMRERAMLVGGTLSATSLPDGGGFEVVFQAPVR